MGSPIARSSRRPQQLGRQPRPKRTRSAGRKCPIRPTTRPNAQSAYRQRPRRSTRLADEGIVEARGFLEGSTLAAWVRAFKCNSVFVTRYRSMRVPVSIRTNCFMADKQALVDSGATNNFMSPAFARKMGLGMKKLDNPRKIFNIDDTENKSGRITHYLDLDVLTKGVSQEMRFLVADLGREELLLGYPWLATFEPSLHWRTATIHEKILPIVISSINPRRIPQFPVIAAIHTEEEKTCIVQELEQDCTIRGISTDLDIQAKKQQEKTIVDRKSVV